MKRKILVGLGTIAAVATPMIAVVSCGSEIIDGKIAWSRNSNKAILNYNVEHFGASAVNDLEAYKGDHVAIAQNFEKAIVQNNIERMTKDVNVQVAMAVEFKEKITGDTSYAAGADNFAYHRAMVMFEFKFGDLPAANAGAGLKPQSLTTNFIIELDKFVTAHPEIFEIKTAAVLPTATAGYTNPKIEVKTGDNAAYLAWQAATDAVKDK